MTAQRKLGGLSKQPIMNQIYVYCLYPVRNKDGGTHGSSPVLSLSVLRTEEVAFDYVVDVQ